MTQTEVGGTSRTTLALRRMMVDGQIRTFDVTDQRVLEMFYRIPRETALPPALAPLAYSDAPIVLPMASGADGRALMQPMFLAKLLQNGDFQGTERVLVVAGATGYAAAIVSGLAASVVSLESDPTMTAAASVYLAALGLAAVKTVTGPLAEGCAADAPYDCILVNGAADCGLERLFGQLVPGGCLLAIETASGQASRRAGKAVRLDKVGGEMSRRTLFDATVPVIEAFREQSAFVF